MGLECAYGARTSSGKCADYARDILGAFVQTAHMDKRWFITRKKELKLRQEDIAAAIGRDRSIVSKILNGKLPFSLNYAPGLAAVFQVSREEILRRANVLDTPAPAGASIVSMPVVLPSGAALARLFDGLLPKNYSSLDRQTLVQTLAHDLPAGFAAMSGVLSEEEMDEETFPDGTPPPPSKGRRGQRPARHS
jgi:transcriptional regulator with XRE-family HTH domain